MKKPILLSASLLLALLPMLDGCARRAAVPTPPAAPVAAPAREERLVIAYAGADGKTALELLKARARVRTSTSSLGELVEEINGVRGSAEHRLLYFVNGQMAATGAANYVTKNGDQIEWKLIGPRKNQ